MVKVRPEGPSWGLSRREETGGGGRSRERGQEEVSTSSDPHPSAWGLQQPAQAPLRLPLTPTHTHSPRETLGHPQTARLTMGPRRWAQDGAAAPVVLSSL